MKTVLCLILLALLSCIAVPAAFAADVVLTWDAPQFRDNGDPLSDLAGYHVHWGGSTRVYDFQRDAGNARTFTVQQLTPGATYYFAVTAYDAAGVESDYSLEGKLTLAAPPGSGGKRSAPLDYDGDGVSDVALAGNLGGQKIFRLHLSDTGSTTELAFGAPADSPIGGDFDGDGRYDLAVVKTTKRSMQWSIRRSSDEQRTTISFGKAGDTPIGGCDLDGDKKDDLVAVRGDRLMTRRSSDSAVRVKRIALLKNLIALRCAPLREGETDTLVLLTHAPAKRGKQGSGRKSRAGAGPLVIALLSSEGTVRSQFRSSRLSDVAVLDLNADGAREPAALGRDRGDAILRFFDSAQVNGIPLKLGVAGIKEIAPARLRASSGAIHDGIIITAKNGHRYLFNLADLEAFDLGNVDGEMPTVGGRKLKK